MNLNLQFYDLKQFKYLQSWVQFSPLFLELGFSLFFLFALSLHHSPRTVCHFAVAWHKDSDTKDIRNGFPSTGLSSPNHTSQVNDRTAAWSWVLVGSFVGGLGPALVWAELLVMHARWWKTGSIFAFFVGLPFPMFLAYNNVGLQFLLAIKSMFGQQLACAIHSLYWRCWRTTSDGQQPTAIIFINFTQKGIYVAGRVGGPGCPFGH